MMMCVGRKLYANVTQPSNPITTVVYAIGVLLGLYVETLLIRTKPGSDEYAAFA